MFFRSRYVNCFEQICILLLFDCGTFFYRRHLVAGDIKKRKKILVGRRSCVNCVVEYGIVSSDKPKLCCET